MIAKSKVRNVEQYLIPGLKSFRLVSPELTPEVKAKLRIDAYSDGDKFLPLTIGPVSKFNAEGGWVSLKDQPKENRYVMTVHWQWKDWHGRHYEAEKDVYKDCYQRWRILPPSEELILVNNRAYSDVLNETDKERIKHVINLMLELFGGCDFVQSDFTVPVEMKQKNFELLPPGEYPFERIKRLIEDDPRKKREICLLEERFQFFQNANPTTIVVGCGGYRGYVGFQYKQYLILDNKWYGNAIYVFPANTDLILSYTKKEILDGNLHIDRIQHTKDWCERAKQYLK